VILIQRFGSALNLNILFKMLFLEGAINQNLWGGTTFTRIKTSSHDDMVTSATQQDFHCVATTFIFQFTVIDNEDGTSTDTVDITVNSEASQTLTVTSVNNENNFVVSLEQC